MNRKEILILIGVLMVSISIVISGYLIGEAIKTRYVQEEDLNVSDQIMDLSEVAKYLNMSEGNVRAIIRLEDEEIKKFGSFTGKMFPYFTIDEKQYFYRNEIDVWLMEVASSHRIYDTNKGYILQ